MQRAVQITQHGGPEVLKLAKIPIPKVSSPTELLIRNHSIGVNFIDTYHRTGLYAFNTPGVPGREAAGEIVSLGAEVSKFKPGDRVAYLTASAYAEYGLVDQKHVIKVPDSVDYDHAASILLQGMTAYSLVTRAHQVKPGEWVLIHAGAGGTGSLLTQFCKNLGAHVIATVSTEAKAEIVRGYAADHVLVGVKPEDLPAEVKKLTNDKGVAAVFDGVGKDTFDASLGSLERCGTMVSFGNASGAVPPFSLLKLAKGNYKLLRTTLFNYIVTQEEFDELAGGVMNQLEHGKVKIGLTKYKLEDAAKAHEDLEARKTTGKLLLTL